MFFIFQSHRLHKILDKYFKGWYFYFFLDYIPVSSLTPQPSNVDNNCPDAAEIEVKNGLEIICAFCNVKCQSLLSLGQWQGKKILRKLRKCSNGSCLLWLIGCRDCEKRSIKKSLLRKENISISTTCLLFSEGYKTSLFLSMFFTWLPSVLPEKSWKRGQIAPAKF